MLRATKYLITETDFEKLEPSDAEVCFVGRSNAGKSSLINVLCQKKKMANVSKVPGKTRTINVFEVRARRWIIDLPGYGFATRSRSEIDGFEPMIEGYLKGRQSLAMVFVVLDAVAGPTKLDALMVKWLKRFALPYKIVVNKIDKVGPAKIAVRKKEIAGELRVKDSDIFWVSAKKNLGIGAVQVFVVKLLEGRHRSAGPAAG